MNIFVTGAGGFIGGTIAAHLARRGHRVTGLIRRPEQRAELQRLGIEPLQGSLDDSALLSETARAADAVVNAASADHRGAVEALIAGLEGSGKALLHTSGSSIVGDASGGAGGGKIHTEDDLPKPTAEKAPRVAIDRLVLDAAGQGIRSAVLCNSLIYGHGAVAGTASVQLPRLVAQARKSGVVHYVGSGENVWSNVHVDDVAALYELALDRSPAGMFYFVENGEASFRAMSEAVAEALGLGAPQPWSFDEARAEWGDEMAAYAMGSNSRVRAEWARKMLGWQPRHASVLDWIRREMVRSDS